MSDSTLKIAQQALLISQFSFLISLLTLMLGFWNAATQTALSRRKLRLDLFDRRYSAWVKLRDEINDYFKYIVNIHSKDPKEINERFILNERTTREAVEEMRFLFDKEVIDAASAYESACKIYHHSMLGEYESVNGAWKRTRPKSFEEQKKFFIPMQISKLKLIDLISPTLSFKTELMDETSLLRYLKRLITKNLPAHEQIKSLYEIEAK